MGGQQQTQTLTNKQRERERERDQVTLTLTDIYCAHGYVCEREGERGCEHYYKSDTVRENERKRERVKNLEFLTLGIF